MAGEIEGAAIVAICDRDPHAAEAARRPVRHRTRASPTRPSMLAARTARLRRHRHDRGQPPAAGRTGAVARRADDLPEALRPTLDDARRWSPPAQAAGVPLMVHENFRWQSPIRAVQGDARQRRDRRALLGPRHVPFRPTTSSPASPTSPRAKRFIVEDLGIHVLDIARYLFGDVSHADGAHGAGQPAHRRRGRRHHAAGPRERRSPRVVDCSYATKLADGAVPADA